MTSPGHVMILASAGSGKTHALTNRFVRLLADGAAPERIVALTFTRKAAGEFFDVILRKLARGADSAEAARALAAELGRPQLQQGDFLRMLRGVVDAMPRLNLGTLDRFFTRIVRTFPLELGLAGEFTLLEEAAARQERRQVMQRLFNAAAAPSAGQQDFIEAFRRATFGSEEKRLVDWLDQHLREEGELVLAAPDPAAWGQPGGIWPNGNEWLETSHSREAARESLRVALPWTTLNDKQRDRLERFLAEEKEWRPGAPLGRALRDILEKVLDDWEAVGAGRAEIMIERRKVSLDPAAARALAALVRAIVRAEFERRIEMTRGIHAVLRGYESLYHDAVRRVGRLTFADVLRLLLPSAGVPALTGDAAAEGRLLVDWRLDARYDHWLLDEFQDTSFNQWSILRNLIDEAVQDPERRRSFFYVGDVKQSIFGWREGDVRLFREIFDHYNAAAPGTIAEERHTSSWRSGPAVISMVNQVFGSPAALREAAPATAAERWQFEWREHASARPALNGRAELRRAAGEEGRFAETLRILREIEPVRRGLSAAVLVQKNKTGNRLADFLRREGGIAAVSASDQLVALDNPFTAALLALLRVAAHPGDSLARGQLAMTPVQAILRAGGLESPEELTRRLLAGLEADGFAATIESWFRRLEPCLDPSDCFNRMRAWQLVEAARKFDEAGSRSVADFLGWAEEFTVRDTDAGGVVRVLTVHKAKGLGFDVVILPDLEGSLLARRGTRLAVKRAADRSVSWVFSPPVQPFGDRDAVLQDYFAAEEADDAYEELCKYYVAMTRAKQGMYLIAEPPKGEARTFSRILTHALGESWAAGDPRWYEGVEPGQPAAETAPALEAWSGATATRTARLPSRRPSDAGHGVRTIPLFAGIGDGAADFGRQVHRIFEHIEWHDAGAAVSPAFATPGVGAEAIAEVQRVLAVPAVAAVLARPDGSAEVWRERAFEFVLDGAWLSGVFDRLTIRRKADGTALGATVVDFKTDRPRAGEPLVAGALARHGGQLNQYRRVAAALTGLPASQVKCFLVLTATGEVAEVPAD